MTKVLGILGGMSWVSTLDYYRLINEGVAAARGGQHSAELLLASVDFQPVVKAQAKGDWDRVGDLLAGKARALEAAGATAFLIASNTMHCVLPRVEAAVGIPALSIFDATAAALTRAGKTKAALLGTRYTMAQPFFRAEYARRGITVIAPPPDDAKGINEIIFRELIHNVVTPKSRSYYLGVVARLAAAGTDAVIMGCTEIGLLLKPGEAACPLFDTAALHAAMATAWLLQP